jgi:hypothetical protein
MWRPNNLQWWVLVIVALCVVFAWPPAEDRSLAIKFVNWAVDPQDRLPVLPEQLGFGVGDDPIAVAEHDAAVQHYDELYQRGGWTRKRLELKVATDPFNKSTVRQLLVAFGVLSGFLAWRFAGRKASS